MAIKCTGFLAACIAVLFSAGAMAAVEPRAGKPEGERIALSYDRRGGYYLAFSGGKDSQALYHLAQLP